jgi:DNA-binding transcriptional MerR regulator
MLTKSLASGTVHKLPPDMRKAILADKQMLEMWEDITPLARNEWICIGIINPVHRGASSKQRVYGEEDLEVLDAVACLSATGMSIPDMRQYMANRDKGAERADEQVQLLSTQKRQLAAQAKLLKVRRQYVDFKIAYWQAVAADNDAAVERIGTEARKLADIIKLPKRV